jgi:hypothetical protein
MKTSDFDEVSRLMYIRGRLREELAKIDEGREKLSGVSAICFSARGIKSTRHQPSDCTIDFDKLLSDIDPDDVD